MLKLWLDWFCAGLEQATTAAVSWWVQSPWEQKTVFHSMSPYPPVLTFTLPSLPWCSLRFGADGRTDKDILFRTEMPIFIISSQRTNPSTPFTSWRNWALGKLFHLFITYLLSRPIFHMDLQLAHVSIFDILKRSQVHIQFVLFSRRYHLGQ